MSETKTTAGVPLPDPEEVQQSVRHFLEGFRARPGYYITIGVVLLAVAFAVIAFLSMGPGAEENAFTPLVKRYDAARMLLARDASAATPIADLEAYVETIRGTPEEGIGLWYAAIARYREAWTADKVTFEERRPHLEKAVAYLEELDKEPKFDDLFIAKDRWFTSGGPAPIRRLLEQAKADLGWAREHDRPEPEPDRSLVAVLRTELGDIYLAFYRTEAPEHAKAFVINVRQGTYNGTAFFFVRGGTEEPTGVMAGDPFTFFYNDALRKDHILRWGGGGTGFGLPPEESRFRIFHRRGVVTSQRTERADWDNAVQFQILVGRDTELDRVHTPFAKVIEGMDVVDKIAKRKTAAQHSTFKDDNAFASIRTRDLLVEPVWILKAIAFENGQAPEHEFPLAEGERKLETLRGTPVVPLSEDDLRAGRELRAPDAADVVPGRHFPYPGDLDPEKRDPKGERRVP
jgi:peptidyl-prolyl cis-trans isomerase B (cyclophilin B)